MSSHTPADRLSLAIEQGRVPDLHAVVAVRDGEVVLEHYGEGEDFILNEPLGHVRFTPGTLHDIRSVTKSVVGLLYGIALADGQVPEPHESLLAHFPEYPDLAEDPRRAVLTVEHALTMTLGLEWNENVPYTSPANSEIAMELAPDRFRYILRQPIVDEPGVRWSYCGGASALVARLIEKGTGLALEDYGRAKLFEPLGIADFAWSTGEDGTALAASGLRLTLAASSRSGGWCSTGVAASFPRPGWRRRCALTCGSATAPRTATTGTWATRGWAGSATAASGSTWRPGWTSRSPSPRDSTTCPTSRPPRWYSTR